ncbi:MAG: thermosome subunit alpha [Candidatus Syntropharchaeia archaeon]
MENEEVPPEEVQESNMLISVVFSEMFKPTLGPLGSNKLILKEMTKGEVSDLVSSNGLAILRELDYEHPTAKILMNAGLTQGRETGDGVSTVMILLGELVKRGFELKKSGIHQQVIVRGYKKALEKTKEFLEDLAIREVSEDILEKIAMISLREDLQSKKIAQMIVQAVKRIGDEFPIDVDDVTVIAETGESVSKMEFYDGVIVDREVISRDMPKRIENAKIALLNLPIEYREPKSKVRKAGRSQDFVFSISKPSQFKEMLKKRGELFEEIISAIIDTGANVLCCQKGIDEDAIKSLREAGILTLKRVKNTDMKRLKKSTGGKIMDAIEDIKSSNLGKAKLVFEKEIGGDKYVFFEGCPYQKSSAIIIRGASTRVLEGIVAEVKSAMHCVAAVMEDRKILPGGGAVEIELAQRLRKFASGVKGKEQLAINAFSESLEEIALSLAKNSGLNPIDARITLRKEHSDGNANMGIFYREIDNVVEKGVIEPFRVKLQAMISATDAACAIIKMDDLIIAKQKEKPGLPIEQKAPEFRYKGGRIKY